MRLNFRSHNFATMLMTMQGLSASEHVHIIIIRARTRSYYDNRNRLVWLLKCSFG